MRVPRNDHSPEAEELRAAQHALATDPVNTGALGTVDINSPAGQRNQDVQERLYAAEAAYRASRS
jgi:hypothetical protein